VAVCLFSWLYISCRSRQRHNLLVLHRIVVTELRKMYSMPVMWTMGTYRLCQGY